MMLNEYSPALRLHPFILHYRDAIIEAAPDQVIEQKIIPSGFIELILHLNEGRCEIIAGNRVITGPKVLISGFWTNPFTIRFHQRVESFSIRFKPEAMDVILGISAGAFVNRSANGEGILAPAFVAFCQRLAAERTVARRVDLVNAYFLDSLNEGTAVPKKRLHLMKALEVIRRGENISVDTLCEEVCVSKRHLEREFKVKMGMSPKTYMRIARVNRVLTMMNESRVCSLSDLSYVAGYADQAHFTRDFKAFTGETPRCFLSGLRGAVPV